MAPCSAFGVNRINRQGVEEAKFSEADWCNLLSISHRYECGRARERSIREINKLDPPVNDADKIAMAKKFGVEEWLLPACVALVERREPLSYAEAEKLGLGMTVLLSAVREKWLQRQQNPSYNAFNSYGQQPNKDSTRFVKVVLWESQEKLDAAGRIEATYIRHLTRKKAFSMSTDVNAIRVRFWIQLQTRTAEMDWGRLSVYKLMLLGPVVHILVCLEVLGAATESAKRDARKRFNVAHHQELEDLMKSMERYRSGPSPPLLSCLTTSAHSPSGLLKAIIDLRKKLAPSSNFHERQDLRALKAAVLEVQMVIEQAAKDSFFVSDMKRIGQDWDLGRKGILEEAMHRKV